MGSIWPCMAQNTSYLMILMLFTNSCNLDIYWNPFILYFLYFRNLMQNWRAIICNTTRLWVQLAAQQMQSRGKVTRFIQCSQCSIRIADTACSTRIGARQQATFLSYSTFHQKKELKTTQDAHYIGTHMVFKTGVAVGCCERFPRKLRLPPQLARKSLHFQHMQCTNAVELKVYLWM